MGTKKTKKTKQGESGTITGKDREFVEPTVHKSTAVTMQDGKPTRIEKDEDGISAAFDKSGANHIVTMRDGSPKRVWFRDGKEIGVENV